MRNIFRTVLIAALSLAIYSSVAEAKSTLSFPVIGVRSQSMGNAFVAVANDVTSISWNPAGLAFVKDQQATVSHSDLYALGVDFNYAAYAQERFGVGWAHMDSGSGFLLGGGDFTQDQFIFSGAHQLDPQTYIGASLKWHRQKYNPPGTLYQLPGSSKYPESLSLSGDGFSLDVGALYLVDETTTVGLAVYDLFGELKTKNSNLANSSDNLDPNICVGFARKARKDTLYSLQISHLGQESTVHAGIEKQLQNELILRAGVDDEVITAGLGFIHNEWELNYSYKNKTSLGLDKTQRFGAIVHF